MYLSRGYGVECRLDGWVADLSGEGFALVSSFLFVSLFLCRCGTGAYGWFVGILLDWSL